MCTSKASLTIAGYQHGYLLAREIEQYIDRCAAQLDSKSKTTCLE